MNTPTTILAARDLRFTYSKHELFSQLYFNLPKGVTLVRGGENKGKTTLLRLLAGDLAADAGELSINGIDAQVQPAAYKQQVFWIDPRSVAHDQTTPADYFKSVQNSHPKLDPLLLAELIEGLSLTEHVDKSIYMLSAGSKRKVWLAAAFAAGATVTLLDEPFAALDMASIRFIMKLLGEAAQHHQRAWVIADYEAPKGLALAGIVDLGAN